MKKLTVEEGKGNEGRKIWKIDVGGLSKRKVIKFINDYKKKFLKEKK